MRKSIGAKLKVFCLGIVVLLGQYSFLQAKPAASSFKVLAFYTPYAQMGDAAHAAFALEANTWFPTVAAANGFTYESTTNWGDLNATKLAGYKVIMWLDNYTGDGNQRTAFQNYVTNGGGFIGFHVSAFNQNPADWSWYFSTFLAMGSYKNNTWAPTTAVLTVEDTSYVITKGFPKIFTGPVNEWYAWNNDLRKNADIKVLCSINAASYPLGTGTGAGGASEIWQNNGEYRPIIWTNTKYKMMYTNIGHDDVDYSTRIGKTKAFDTLLYAKIVLNAIKYFAGVTTSIEGSKEPTGRLSVRNIPFVVKTNRDFITVSYSRSDKFNVSIIDLKGRIVYSGIGRSNECVINRNAIVQGSYIVKIKSGNIALSQKLLTND